MPRWQKRRGGGGLDGQSGRLDFSLAVVRDWPNERERKEAPAKEVSMVQLASENACRWG